MLEQQLVRPNPSDLTASLGQSRPIELEPALDVPLPPPPGATLPAIIGAVPVRRRRLDVRGFLAGMALSGAFGVVFYIYLMGG
jgi:hypothetical protein